MAIIKNSKGLLNLIESYYEYIYIYYIYIIDQSESSIAIGMISMKEQDELRSWWLQGWPKSFRFASGPAGPPVVARCSTNRFPRTHCSSKVATRRVNRDGMRREWVNSLAVKVVMWNLPGLVNWPIIMERFTIFLKVNQLLFLLPFSIVM